MLRSKWIGWALVCGLTTALTAGSALGQFGRQRPQPGQKPGGQKMPMPKGENIEKPIKGTIEQLMPLGRDIGVKMNVGGETYAVKIPANAKMRVSGSAQLDFLRPGIFIQFSAMVDKKARKLKEEPIKKLTVFTPSNELAPGVFPDVGSSAAEGDFQPQIVAGQIMAIADNDVTLNVPNLAPKLKVELASEPAIDVNLSGDWYNWVKAGDSLEITRGQCFNPPAGAAPPGAPAGAAPAAMKFAQASEGKIVLANPLTGASGKKKPGLKSSRGKKEKEPDENK